MEVRYSALPTKVRVCGVGHKGLTPVAELEIGWFFCMVCLFGLCIQVFESLAT